MTQPIKALIVLTSIDKMPGTDRPTGYYIDEMAAPYVALRDAGAHVAFASIAGGAAPIDPNSLPADEADRPAPVEAVLSDADVVDALGQTTPIADIDPRGFDVVYLPGGHGTMWDFRQSADLARVVSEAWQNGAVVGAVCHGPAGLIEATDASGTPIVKGRRVSSFTDDEERAVELDTTVPYLLETALREKGATFEKADNFQPHAVRDGRLVTGQNPASAEKVGALLVEALSAREKAAA